MTTPNVIFLPGASGDPRFWQPVSELLPTDWNKILMSWPGLGDQPDGYEIDSIEELARLVLRHLDWPGHLVAQSMGGAVALRLAIDRPGLVRSLTLAATSGGFNIAADSPYDWRAEYRREYPNAAQWILDVRPDYTAELGKVAAPCLVLGGDDDPIVPVQASTWLAHQLPRATLNVLAGGTHSFARDNAAKVAGLVMNHISSVDFEG